MQRQGSQAAMLDTGPGVGGDSGTCGPKAHSRAGCVRVSSCWPAPAQEALQRQQVIWLSLQWGCRSFLPGLRVGKICLCPYPWPLKREGARGLRHSPRQTILEQLSPSPLTPHLVLPPLFSPRGVLMDAGCALRRGEQIARTTKTEGGGRGSQSSEAARGVSSSGEGRDGDSEPRET